MERPRTLRICSYGRLSMRRPSKRTWPPLIRPGGSSKPMIAAPVSDFPAPDSPTTPRISPGAIEKLTPSSATNRPRRPANSTWRLSTSSSGDGMRLGRRRRRAPAHGLFVVHSDVEIRGELVGADCHQVIPRARSNVERDLALESRAAGAARRALDDDLANAGIDQDGTKGRVLAVDASNAMAAIAPNRRHETEGDFMSGLLAGADAFGGQRRRGFNASRNQSPNRLMLRAISTSVAPGKITSHQAPLNNCLLPSLMKVPSEGEVGETPTPRKESVASARMATAT